MAHATLTKTALQTLRRLEGYFTPFSFRRDLDSLRQASLQIRFSLLGTFFGTLYALFYLCIDHIWGAAIIVFCSTLFAGIPWILKTRKCLALTGNLFALVLLLGFTGLCLVEGGLHGHAIAWMACIPLCVLLLVGLKMALIWSATAFTIVLAFGISDALGVHFEETYDPRWHTLVSAAGYAGLLPFMTLLGFIFERTRKQAFERLRRNMEKLGQLNKELVDLHEEKNAFLDYAAHDLKNPLSTIAAYSNVLEALEEPTPEETSEYASCITRCTYRMLDLVNNLLDVRSIEERRFQVKHHRIQVSSLFTELDRTQGEAAFKKQIRIFYAIEAKQMVGDQNGLMQILENLLSNAIKYPPPERMIWVRSDSKGANIVLTVEDEGPGLSEADQAKLFQKFSRLSSRPTGGENSVGLGLWIVQRLAQAMGGEVWCKSSLGRGSTFGVTIPHQLEQVDQAEAA